MTVVISNEKLQHRDALVALQEENQRLAAALARADQRLLKYIDMTLEVLNSVEKLVMEDRNVG